MAHRHRPLRPGEASGRSCVSAVLRCPKRDTRICANRVRSDEFRARTKLLGARPRCLTSVTETSRATTEVKPFRVLICDDQADVLEALRLLLKGQGWQTLAVDSPDALLHAVRKEAVDLILVDLNYTRDTTSGQEGMDLLATLE